jgi:hypothetical protein
MKEKFLILKMQKFFDFLKWTKINVQKLNAKKLLTEKILKNEKRFLSSQNKPLKNICD